MKFTPAKPPITGETLESLAGRLRERGEPAFRAKQILDWVYKKRAQCEEFSPTVRSRAS